ncbi:MAG TPA: hypothetical protein VLZ53_04150 [Devosia sp.]|nr:hypothetical protein [Devosia sp.]
MAARKTVMTGALSALVLALAIPASAALAQGPDAVPSQALPGPSKTYTPPRTGWGDPDLRGTWPLDAVGQTPMQRPEKFGNQALLSDEEYAAALKRAADMAAGADREDRANKLGTGNWFERGNALRQTSLITQPANGRIPPMTALGQTRAAAMKSSWSEKVFDSLADFNSLDRCITRGLPASMVPFPYNNGVRIFQAPGYVVINLELVHETRIIPLSGKASVADGMETWLGASHGRFEGSTLVIETTHFNGQSPMVIVGPSNKPVPTSKAMRIVEHLTPTGPDSIYYEAWVEDPENLTAPWKMEFPWTRDDSYQPFEYACHEGNTLIGGYIKATSPRYAAMRKAAGGE